jgi:hypothetical protein
MAQIRMLLHRVAVMRHCDLYYRQQSAARTRHPGVRAGRSGEAHFDAGPTGLEGQRPDVAITNIRWLSAQFGRCQPAVAVPPSRHARRSEVYAGCACYGAAASE